MGGNITPVAVWLGDLTPTTRGFCGLVEKSGVLVVLFTGTICILLVRGYRWQQNQTL